MAQAILTPAQKRFLQVFGKSDLASHFYLSGGTALVAHYIPYRLSDDLDFFSPEEFPPEAITSFLKQFKKEIGYRSFDFQKSFNRNLYFLQTSEGVLKVEFTYYPFPPLARPKVVDGVRVDSLHDIAVNKVFTIALSPRTRDFLDLYFILKEKDWDFFDLLKRARAKFDWHIDLLNLGSQLMKSQQISDYPRILQPIDDKKWQSYCLALVEQLGKKI